MLSKTTIGINIVFVILAITFILSTLLVSTILKFAKNRAWYDQLNERKIHRGLVPRLGGVGFSFSFIIITLIVLYFLPSTIANIDFNHDILAVFIAAAIIIAAGVVDDFRSIRPRYKLIIQIAAAVVVLSLDITFHTIKLPLLPLPLDLGLFRFPITLIWIIGVTNAVNLIDGVDGLAGGVTLIASVALALFFAIAGNENASLLSLILAASIGGFLVFNLPFPKAKIFMGDCGSQFLGFMLAVLPLLDNGAGDASLPLPLAAALISIPVFDTFAAIWRRIREGRHIVSPDRQHMHHKLLNLGFSVFHIDVIIWAMQAIICLFVLLSYHSNNLLSLIYLVIPFGIVGAFFSLLHFRNRRLTVSHAKLCVYPPVDTATEPSINPAV